MYIAHGKMNNPIDFQGQESRVPIGKYENELVNTKECVFY